MGGAGNLIAVERRCVDRRQMGAKYLPTIKDQKAKPAVSTETKSCVQVQGACSTLFDWRKIDRSKALVTRSGRSERGDLILRQLFRYVLATFTHYLMKPFTLVSIFVAFACAFTFASAAENRSVEFPPHIIENSQLRVLPANAAGRYYQLHIGLPASYSKETSKRYPVVFVTDAYWDFVKITSIGGGLVYDKVVPEFITVGLGYAGENLDYGNLRRWELSPASFGDVATSGHAADFLKTIEKEIIPFVEREYRADPSYRVLAGASLGGLFTLYAMYTQPDLFQAYIAATPAVIVGDDWLFAYEEAFAHSKRALKTRLFISGGGNESPGFLGGILRFNQRISSRASEGLAYKFRIIDEERHAGMQFESYTRGLRFAFAPLAPESGSAGDR